METLRVKAPGKVILFGEHAVVYGTRAIAVSVGLFTHLTLTPCQSLRLEFPAVGLDTTLDLDQLRELKKKLGADFRFDVLNAFREVPINDEAKTQLLEFTKGHQIQFEDFGESLKPAQDAAFQSFLFIYLALFEELTPFHCQIETELPVGAGLGSSASFGVALAGALLLAANREKKKGYNVDTINRWAFVSEKFVHGSPSGVDNSVASFGGGIVFKKGEPLQHIVECPDIHVLLVNTKVPRSTKVMVAKAVAVKDSNPILFESTIAEIDTLVGTCVTQIESGQGLDERLIRRNQELLFGLGVSHPALDLIVQLAKDNGLEAKLTGAGGGGCAFIYIPPNHEQKSLDSLLSALKSNQFQVWDTILGCKGFTVEEVL